MHQSLDIPVMSLTGANREFLNTCGPLSCLAYCVRVCVCACVSISNRKIAGSIPAEYGSTRLSSPSLSWVATNSQMCMSKYVW